jgi:hypothetical protein
MRVSEDQTADSYSVPAPTGGWNARDPLDLMAPDDAVELVNAFPDSSKVTTRDGYSLWQDESGAIGFLAEFVKIDGTRKLIGGEGGYIYDYSSFGAPAVLGGAGAFTNNTWQTASYLNQIVFVNGSDQPQKYDGTTFAASNYTTIADDSVLVNVSVYRNRLYFIQKNSTKIWYGGTTSISGALTEFDISDILKMGGSLLFAGSLSHDTGNGLQDVFIIISTEGEVIAYTGSYPGGTDWLLVGRYLIPRPLGGYRCAFNLFSDLAIITENGVFEVSKVISQDATEGVNAISDKVQNAFSLASKNYRDNDGWCGLYCPREKWVIFNIPVIEGTQSEQYVMNAISGAWCKFTGMNATCWCNFDGKPFFGTSDGGIYKASSGTNDNGAAIPVTIKQAFNYFDNRENIKQFLQLKPLILASGGIELELGVDVDNRSDGEYTTVTAVEVAGGDWDTSDWDTSDWAGSDIDISTWETIYGLGRSGSIKIRASLLNVNFSLTASHISYRLGGII